MNPLSPRLENHKNSNFIYKRLAHFNVRKSPEEALKLRTVAVLEPITNYICVKVPTQMRTYQQQHAFRAKQRYGHSLGTVRGLAPTLLSSRAPRSPGLDPSQVLRPNRVLHTDDNGTSKLERIVLGWSRLPNHLHRRQPQPIIPVTIARI